jgi:cytochrome b subunit of formate dehydrogenase
MKAPGKLCLQTFILSLLLCSCASFAAHKPKDQDCLACHSDPTLAKDVNGKAVSLTVDGDKLKHSIHGSMLSCVDCHKDVTASPHDKTPQKVTCAQCHADADAAYQHSSHSKPSKAGGPAATCVDCHGGPHGILPASDPKSAVNHANIPTTCGRCHGQKFLMESNGQSSQPFTSYQESVHGRAIEKGSKTAAVCTDCHGSHEILPANDQKSSIFKFNIPTTCGKCHQQVKNVFMQSIHGQAITKGNGLAPVCTDCHGIHTIKNPIDPKSSVSEQNVARTTCAHCHEGVQLSQELGVAGSRISTYLDSYHGLASKGGSVVVANCASCHGVHNILPSSDPHSTINKANLDATCGQCHKGVTQKFTLNKVHMGGGQAKDAGSVAVRWIRFIYIWLIVVVISGMALHNIILWRGKALARRRAQSHAQSVERMSPNQRLQHLTLLISFVVLVITGFALKYPDSWFAHKMGMGESLRGIIHRIAGVILIAAGVYHVVYVVITREGRKLLRDLVPVPKDAVDVVGTMGHSLGLIRKKPQYARFNYAEKAEYWALVWGTALMAGTGIMLWAKVLFGNLLDRWWLDAATAVHFYEAILATLAIIVWHLYQVLFDPDVYPMNWAWWDGRMSVKHYREEHGLDTETLSAAEAESGKSTPEIEPPQQ